LKLFKSELFKNIALAIVSTGLMLFLLEMVLRVTEVVPARTLEYADPVLWRTNIGPLKPGQTFTDRFKRQLPFTVTVNNLGLRGRDLSPAKTPGATRILCLGDSYTFGAYVDDTETWPAQLEEILKERNPARDLDVVNAGISGFTIVDELDFLKEHGLDLQPDIVVLAFVLNDLADLTRRVSSREMLKRASEEAASSALGPLKAHLRQTAIYNSLFMLKAYIRRASGSDPTVQEVDIRHLLQREYDATTLGLFEQYKGHLAEMKSLLDQRGIKLVFMIFPYWEQVSQGATDEAQRRLLEMASQVGVTSLDLLPTYRKHDPRGRKFFHMPWDHHPSARGYRRAARDLADTLAPLLPGGQPGDDEPED